MTTLPFISVSALTTLGVAVFTSYAIQTLIMSVADQGQLNELSYRIGKMIVKLDYISLVNLILDKPCVTELIQGDFNAKRVTKELNAILYDEQTKARIKAQYAELHGKIGTSHPSIEVANHIWQSIS